MSWFKELITGTQSDEGVAVAEDTDEQTEGELAIDVYQDKDNVIVKSTIAGVEPEDLDITVSSGNEVTISGERKQGQEVAEDDYFFQECYWGAFSRTFTLPVEVDMNNVTADIKDGVLTVTLPKAGRRTKKVKVTTEE